MSTNVDITVCQYEKKGFIFNKFHVCLHGEYQIKI